VVELRAGVAQGTEARWTIREDAAEKGEALAADFAQARAIDPENGEDIGVLGAEGDGASRSLL